MAFLIHVYHFIDSMDNLNILECAVRDKYLQNLSLSMNSLSKLILGKFEKKNFDLESYQ